MTYISSRNGISRRNTFFVASSLRSCRRWTAATGVVSDISSPCFVMAGSCLMVGFRWSCQGRSDRSMPASVQCMYLPPSTWMVAPLM